MSIKMIVFDMAGTTIDENNVVYKTLRQAIQNAGFDVSLEQVLELGAGKEKKQALTDILTRWFDVRDPARIRTIFARFENDLDLAYQTLDVRPMPGAEDVFQELKRRGIRVTLNTGYSQVVAEKLLRKVAWEPGETFDDLVTASQVNEGRPGPAMIQLAMRRGSIQNPALVAKVGDSIIDIEEGKNALCALSIGITTGAHTEEQLRAAAPDFIIHNLNELPGILDGAADA